MGLTSISPRLTRDTTAIRTLPRPEGDLATHLVHGARDGDDRGLAGELEVLALQGADFTGAQTEDASEQHAEPPAFGHGVGDDVEDLGPRYTHPMASPRAAPQLRGAYRVKYVSCMYARPTACYRMYTVPTVFWSVPRRIRRE